MNTQQKVRLSDDVIKAISKIFFKTFLPNDELWLFGSRVDESKKGGDIDLYIETNLSSYDIAVNKKIIFLSELKEEIGDQKIDVVLNLLSSNYQLPIYEIARTNGVRLI